MVLKTQQSSSISTAEEPDSSLLNDPIQFRLLADFETMDRLDGRRDFVITGNDGKGTIASDWLRQQPLSPDVRESLTKLFTDPRLSTYRTMLSQSGIFDPYAQIDFLFYLFLKLPNTAVESALSHYQTLVGGCATLGVSSFEAATLVKLYPFLIYASPHKDTLPNFSRVGSALNHMGLTSPQLRRAYITECVGDNLDGFETFVRCIPDIVDTGISLDCNKGQIRQIVKSIAESLHDRSAHNWRNNIRSFLKIADADYLRRVALRALEGPKEKNIFLNADCTQAIDFLLTQCSAKEIRTLLLKAISPHYEGREYITVVAALPALYQLLKEKGFNDQEIYNLVLDANEVFNDKHGFPSFMLFIDAIRSLKFSKPYTQVQWQKNKPLLCSVPPEVIEKGLLYIKRHFTEPDRIESIRAHLGEDSLLEFSAFLGNSRVQDLDRYEPDQLVSLCKRLRQEKHISYYGRFAVDIAEAIVHAYNTPEQKRILMITCATDPNGAFYSLTNDFRLAIAKGYALDVIETKKGKKTVFHYLRTAPDHAYNELCIAAHGFRKGAELSQGNGPDDLITYHDRRQWQPFAQKLRVGARIVMASCSTGWGGFRRILFFPLNFLTFIYGEFREVPGLTAYAPGTDTAVSFAYEEGALTPRYTVKNGSSQIRVKPVIAGTTNK